MRNHRWDNHKAYSFSLTVPHLISGVCIDCGMFREITRASATAEPVIRFDPHFETMPECIDPNADTRSATDDTGL